MVYELSNAANLKNLAEEKDQSEQTASIIRRLLDSVKVEMASVAKGDLSKKITVETEGELAELKGSVDNAISLLGRTVAQVDGAVKPIETGTSQVSTIAQSVASGATEQAASLQEISSSMQKIGSKK